MLSCLVRLPLDQGEYDEPHKITSLLVTGAVAVTRPLGAKCVRPTTCPWSSWAPLLCGSARHPNFQVPYGLWANPNQDFGILRSNSHFRVVLKGKPKGKELMFRGSLKTRYPHIVKLLEPSDCKSSSFVASPVGSRMASYMATSICLLSFVISLWWLKESSTSGNIFCIFPRGLSKWRTI